MRLACVGNALWDIVSFVGEDFASSLGYHGGSTTHADIADLEPVIADLPGSYRCAGGGAANAARVFASLGHDAAFAGMIGPDETGKLFGADIAGSGIEPFLQLSSKPTGVFCALRASTPPRCPMPSSFQVLRSTSTVSSLRLPRPSSCSCAARRQQA